MDNLKESGDGFTLERTLENYFDFSLPEFDFTEVLTEVYKLEFQPPVIDYKPEKYNNYKWVLS